MACGTGDFTIEIAQKAAPGSRVSGIDLSEGMMKIGREKIKAAGGIASIEDAEDFINLGATRLGTSRLVKIMKENENDVKKKIKEGLDEYYNND